MDAIDPILYYSEVEIRPVFDPRSGRRQDASFPPYPDALDGADTARWLDSLQVTAVSAAEWRAPAGWRVPRRVLATANYAYYQRGRAWISLPSGELAVRAGDLVLLPPGEPHAVRQDPRDPVRASAGHFHARLFGGVDALGLLGFPRLISLRRPRDEPALDAIAALAREYALRAPGHAANASALVRVLLMHLVRHHGSAFTPIPARADWRDAARILPAMRLIDERLDDPDLSVGELARAVGISEVRLRSLFRRACGESPVRWLQRRRLERACELLRQGSDPVQAIAERVGFVHAPFFHRVFRARLGTTPQRYRETAD